jgi:mono/diheme cytochrome c family protein
MPPVKPIAIVAACLALLAADSPPANLFLHTTRRARTDLEITGMVANIAPDEVRYISYESLLDLPQVTINIVGDGNFDQIPNENLIVTGVYLDVLQQRIGPLPSSDLITALCSDGYHSIYTRDYVRTHRPILALKIDGLPVDAWVAQTHKQDPGTYFITYENFTPSFSILSYKELPQIPASITRLHFDSSQRVFSSIAPRGNDASNPQVLAGFHIAQQHCYRCHNMDNYGGTKARKTWQTLGDYAAKSPSAFESYLRNPKSINPRSEMTPNSQFDDATAQALQAYFQTFATGAP